MQKEYFDNFEKYKDKFEVGGKYNSLKEIDTIWLTNALKEVNWKIKLASWHTPKWKNFNYVLLNENWKTRLVFWENHSYLSNWKNVDYAWSIKFTNKWNIHYINNGSWHYLPDFDDIGWKNKVIDAIKERFWIDIELSIFKNI